MFKFFTLLTVLAVIGSAICGVLVEKSEEDLKPEETFGFGYYSPHPPPVYGYARSYYAPVAPPPLVPYNGYAGGIGGGSNSVASYGSKYVFGRRWGNYPQARQPIYSIWG